MQRIKKWLETYRYVREGLGLFLVFILVIALGCVAWQWGRQGIAEEIYRERLLAVNEQYVALQQRYDSLVKQTAITELEVEKGKVSVNIRHEDGYLLKIPTALDVNEEVYVDYVVAKGRLWIRRVFDSSMTPNEAMVIDPSLGEVDWSDASLTYGKAVYRQLSEGRWMITMTGNGALNLARVEKASEPSVAQIPMIVSGSEWTEEVDASLETITWQDAARWAMHRIPEIWR